MADENEIALFRELNKGRCSTLHVGGFRPSGNFLATRFGGAPMGYPGEPWPQYKQPEYPGMIGNPGDLRQCAFVCQLNLTEAPNVPAILQGIELVAVYCGFHSADRHGHGGGPLAFSETVAIRSYARLDDLVLMDMPSDAPSGWLREFEARWEETDDQPNYDDPDLVLPEGVSRADDEAEEFLELLENRYCSKVGGFFSSIQSEGSWNYQEQGIDYKFAFQIAEEEKSGLYWIDNGVLGVAAAVSPDGEHLWAADLQFF